MQKIVFEFAVRHAFAIILVLIGFLIIMIGGLFYLTVLLRKTRTGRTAEEVLRQPVAQDKLSGDPIKDMKIFLLLYDRNARWGKKWTNRIMITLIILPFFSAYLMGKVPLWIPELLTTLVGVLQALNAFLKPAERWAKSRAAFHAAANVIQRASYRKLPEEEQETAQWVMEVIEGEQDQFMNGLQQNGALGLQKQPDKIDKKNGDSAAGPVTEPPADDKHE